MYFNFELFKTLAKKAYSTVDSGYLFEDTLAVFEYYFTQYEAAFNEVHPNIRIEQIQRIIELMPSSDYNQLCDIEPEYYKPMIDKHFKTQYRNCDYNINHFFSGNIRYLRLCETCR